MNGFRNHEVSLDKKWSNFGRSDYTKHFVLVDVYRKKKSKKRQSTSSEESDTEEQVVWMEKKSKSASCLNIATIDSLYVGLVMMH